MIENLTLMKLRCQLWDECSRLAVEEFLTEARRLQLPVTREQLEARFKQFELNDYVCHWLSERLQWHYTMHSRARDTMLADLKTLLTEGRFRHAGHDEWMEVGVPTF